MTDGSGSGAGDGIFFAGEVTPDAAWETLASDRAAVLVDVRTDAEWMFVGRPDLSAVAKETWLLSWKMFPSMQRNPDFFAALGEKMAAEGVSTVFMMCRSGARSLEAAMSAASDAELSGVLSGPAQFFNVKEGFEGDLDQERRRGRLNGWKARGLPWVQS